jgi:hypothetical protein
MNLYDPEPTNEGDSQMKHSSDDTVQEIFGSILLRKSLLAGRYSSCFLAYEDGTYRVLQNTGI